LAQKAVTMTLDQATKEAALKALSAIEDFTRAGFEHSVDRVHLYYDDVEGDWLDEFANDEQLGDVCSSADSRPSNRLELKIPFPWQRESNLSSIPLEATSRPVAHSLQKIAFTVFSLHARQISGSFPKVHLKEVSIEIQHNTRIRH
jgi:hypothetical protein